jgi:hypothetical protein
MKEVPFADFVAEIKKEIAYFEVEGIHWRRKVAYLSLAVLFESNIRTTEGFFDKEAVIQLVKGLFPTLNEELVLDIGSFFIKNAKNLSKKENLAEDVKQYVAEQQQKK